MLSLLLLVVVFTTGCAPIVENMPRIANNEDLEEQTVTETIIINPERQEIEEEITLYFKHEFADKLVPSSRLVQKGKQSLEEIVVEELLKGPAKFGRVCIMPPNVKLISVIRKDDTVFVNLNDAFKGEVDLTSLPGKQNVSPELKPGIVAEMKRLAVYSIVNSLTEISGVQQVKILINNRSVSYGDLGLMPLIAEQSSITPDSSVMPLARNSRLVLNPSQTVHEVFTGLAEELSWVRAYSFIAKANIDGEQILPFQEFMEMHKGYVTGITFEVISEEIRHDGTAFVTTNFSITYANGEKREKVNYNLRVYSEEGIWKLIFPDFLLRPDN